MPDFPGTATVITEVEDTDFVFYTAKKNFRSTSMPGGSASQGQADAVASEMGALSNAGLVAYTHRGVKTSIRLAQASWLDETFDENYTARLTFEDLATPDNPQVIVSIPSPGAELFGPSGVIVDETVAAAFITATTAFLNAGGAAYSYQGGALNTASAAEKRPDANFLDPTAGATAPPASPA